MQMYITYVPRMQIDISWNAIFKTSSIRTVARYDLYDIIVIIHRQHARCLLKAFNPQYKRERWSMSDKHICVLFY